MSNPKDLVGSKKAPLGLVPPALEIGAAEAMANGAFKYGPFNWREIPVEYMTYLVAMKRHIAALIDGQDVAEDTGIHHLKHVAAGCGILLDAMNIPDDLIDNRPPKGPAADMLRAQDKSAVVTGFTRCPLCGDPEKNEDIVGGVCLTCADGIAFSQNARRGAVEVPVQSLSGKHDGHPEVGKKEPCPLCEQRPSPMTAEQALADGLCCLVFGAMGEHSLDCDLWNPHTGL